MSEHIRGLSKAKTKYINSLSLKKNRDEHRCFVAEGSKLVYDLYQEQMPLLIVATEEWLEEYHPILHQGTLVIATKQELKTISTLKTPPSVIGVFSQQETTLDYEQLATQNIILLDGIQDPGNLGTIIRTANWFGITHLVCSKDTVDQYNPKVVQSSMGALLHVSVYYTELPRFIRKMKIHNMEIYGTFMEGKNIYTTPWAPCSGFVIGNEGNGISSEVRATLSGEITIPYSTQSTPPESLNAASAIAVVCSEIYRRTQ